MEMATVGTDKYTYELVEDWAKLPAGWTLGQTGIVTDARDRVYLFNRSAHPLMVLDRDGTFFTSWGEGVLSSAHGMFIDQHEHIYLPVINSHVVLKYSPSGNLLMTLGTWNTLYGQKIETCQFPGGYGPVIILTLACLLPLHHPYSRPVCDGKRGGRQTRGLENPAGLHHRIGR